jgi:hypothetical protein
MEDFTQSLLMTAEDLREFHAGFTGERSPSFAAADSTLVVQQRSSNTTDQLVALVAD